MQITIQLDPAAAHWLQHRGQATPDTQELNRIAEQLGVVLRPIHPETINPELGRHFTVEAADLPTAEGMIARLRQSKAVEAAYLKPRDAAP